MPLLSLFRHEETRIGIWEISETSDTLCALLAESGMEVVGNLAVPFLEKRRKEWLAERILLRHTFGLPGDIGHEADGRPFLTAATARLSISHTGPFVALAVAPSQPVGIDIEQYGPRAFRLRDKFLSPGEWGYAAPSQAETWAVTAWSAKEAAFKLFGQKGDSLKDDIRLTETGVPGGTSAIRASLHTDEAQATVHYRFFPSFVFTIAQFPAGNP